NATTQKSRPTSNDGQPGSPPLSRYRKAPPHSWGGGAEGAGGASHSWGGGAEGAGGASHSWGGGAEGAGGASHSWGGGAEGAGGAAAFRCRKGSSPSMGRWRRRRRRGCGIQM